MCAECILCFMSCIRPCIFEIICYNINKLTYLLTWLIRVHTRVCVCLLSVQFWSLVAVDHLLARLELDSPVVARRLVQLLFNSYMPVEKPLRVQLSRAIHLVRSNQTAARKFYLYAYLHMSVIPTSRCSLSDSVSLTSVQSISSQSNPRVLCLIQYLF